MLLQSSPLLSPGRSRAREDLVEQARQDDPAALGTLVVDKIFTFQGPDPKDPKLLLVGMEARWRSSPRENVTAKIRAQEGKGSLTFDAEAGRIVNSRSVQKMEMLIVLAGPGHRPNDRDDLDDDARALDPKASGPLQRHAFRL